MELTPDSLKLHRTWNSRIKAVARWTACAPVSLTALIISLIFKHDSLELAGPSHEIVGYEYEYMIYRDGIRWYINIHYHTNTQLWFLTVYIDSSAIRTCKELTSASEYTATVLIPSLRAVFYYTARYFIRDWRQRILINFALIDAERMRYQDDTNSVPEYRNPLITCKHCKCTRVIN